MAYRVDNLSSNDFGIITIPSTSYDYFNVTLFERDIWSYYSEGVGQTATIINLHPKAIEVIYGMEDITEDIRILNTHFEDPTDEEAAYAYSNMSNNVYWIWGDAHTGGLYCRRYGERGLIFGLFQGLYKYDEGETWEGEYRFVFMEDTTHVLTIDETNQIAITMDEASIQNIIPSFYIYYKDQNSDLFISEHMDAEAVPIGEYRCINTDGTVEQMLNDYMWTEGAAAGTMTPVQIWKGNGEAVVNAMNTEGMTIESNWSWDGNANADPDPEGSSTDGGGDGDWTNKTDPVPLDNPSGGIDAVNSGLVTLYNPTKEQLAQFSGWLFADITDAEADAMKKLRVSPFDYILFLALVQYTPEVASVGSTIQFVGLDSGVASNLVSEQFTTLGDWVWQIGNDTETFLDFNPNCKASIYIPYLGFKEISIDDIRGCKCTLRMNIDQLNGSCVAELHVNRGRRVQGGNADCGIDNNVYQWTGNVFTYVPISAADYRSYLQAHIGMISAGTSMVLSAASGNVGGLISGALNMAGSSMSAKQDVQKSNGSSSSYGIMAGHKPFIMMERPIISEPKRTYNNTKYTYEDEFGIPSNTFRKVSECYGFIQAEFDTLYGNDINGLDDEINEIKELFNNGIYLPKQE